MSIWSYNLSREFDQVRSRGMTLLELLVVVSVISVLSKIAISAYNEHSVHARTAQVVVNLKTFATAFRAFELENGEFPAETERALPPGMKPPLSTDLFEAETALGGHFDWESPDSHPYAGVALVDPTDGERAFQRIDRMLDDGNLATGDFRMTDGSRATYIIVDIT